MLQILTQQTTLRLMMISPAQDGSPRRGCEDPHCPAVKGHDSFMLTPDSFAKQPKSYQDLFKSTNLSGQKQMMLPNEWNVQTTSARAGAAAGGGLFEQRTLKSVRNVQLNSAARILSPRRRQTSDQQQSTASGATCVQCTSNAVNTRSCRSKRLSGSAHDYLSELIQSPFNVPELLRAQSEKMLNCSEEGDFKQEMLRSILDNSELCNCQRQLQKAIEEKQELQVLVETLRSELKKERGAHQVTKAELDRLQKQIHANIPK
ncbi:unnamed protein product [Anisakis simplex]|uniref:Protein MICRORCHIDIA 6 n=1 Tax=Anisakis simplex TaxID=6269 RepID=A0A0M3KAM4_ANISI|nr:unnamed protein product [Anisakis simplex]